MGKIALTTLFAIVTIVANCQQEKPLVIKGNELYKRQQYDKAAEEYQKATDLNDKNPLAMYNLGNALYKGKKTEAAEKVYSSAADNAKDATGKSRAVYNKGVALTRQQKLQESISAYKDALRLIPTDEEARQNLQKALNELKKQQQPKEDKKKQDKDNQKQKPNDQPKNKSKLNQKQAEQMLNSLRQEEKKLQQGIQKKNNTGGANSKDW
ncbi:tetratricopeptide repeat protein [Segetibacter sp.]|jgi:Ca-activated chloride channel family protein|uniref:tetratricopeptide repeat protein n=1 Tax=Segetibacter sp. TaxID=2231182 RepID=UPI0026373A1B|nr:tetratricopeptide repeat protein [Segetibacter sp.]MCW3082010.1 Tetratricopeptide 2 repeat-containing protein [Segetibacter sp.]